MAVNAELQHEIERWQPQFKQALLQLLPPGLAYPRRDDSTVAATIDGKAQVLAEHHTFVLDEVQQWLPHKTQRRLPEWEASTGQPDDCSLPDRSFEQRRLKVLQLLRTGAGNDQYETGCPGAPEALGDVLRALGATVTVIPHYSFKVGRNRVGDKLGLPGRITFVIANPYPGQPNPWAPYKAFRVGQNKVGQPLASTQFPELECVMDKIAPARIQLHFIYEE